MRPFVPATMVVLGAALASVIVGCSSARRDAAPALAEVTANADVRTLLLRSCFGCHSDVGRPPWHARIAPSYWGDRSGARRALNFAAWTSYDGATRRAQTAAIAAAVSSGSMPPADYTFFDHSARLSAADRQSIAQWADEASAAH